MKLSNKILKELKKLLDNLIKKIKIKKWNNKVNKSLHFKYQKRLSFFNSF